MPAGAVPAGQQEIREPAPSAVRLIVEHRLADVAPRRQPARVALVPGSRGGRGFRHAGGRRRCRSEYRDDRDEARTQQALSDVGCDWHARDGARGASRLPLKPLSTTSQTGVSVFANRRRRQVDYRLLGPLEVLRDGRPLPLGGGKQRALLALLLLHANEVVSRDRLLEELWGERPPGTADHSLDVQVSRLRKTFEPEEPLLTRAGGYVLQLDPGDVDVGRFERLLADGRSANAAGKPGEALAELESALRLWRGGALADLAYETFARTEVERLEELRLVATEERVDAELALGRHDTLVSELQALVAKYPLRERLRGQLMLALYRSSRQAEALAVYADTRRRLVDELGLEP